MDPATVIAEPARGVLAPPASAIAQIDAARAAFIDAIRSHDLEAIAGLYEDGARLVAPAAEMIRGRADVAAFWQAGMDTGIADVALVPEDLEVVASIAWEVGGYTLRLEPIGQEAIVDRGRYLLVYSFDDGRWRRAAEMFRPDTFNEAAEDQRDQRPSPGAAEWPGSSRAARR
jgi:ketosteroid isomerase-like protein